MVIIKHDDIGLITIICMIGMLHDDLPNYILHQFSAIKNIGIPRQINFVRLIKFVIKEVSSIV